MNIPINQFPSIEQMTQQLNAGKNNTIANNKQLNGTPFGEILRSKQAATESEGLKFSKHANERLASRNIDLTDDQMGRLELGAKKAGEKGN